MAPKKAVAEQVGMAQLGKNQTPQVISDLSKEKTDQRCAAKASKEGLAPAAASGLTKPPRKLTSFQSALRSTDRSSAAGNTGPRALHEGSKREQALIHACAR